MRERERDLGKDRGLRRRTQDRVRLGELERTGTLSQSSFCKHLYRHTEIIEKQFFLHMVCLCICVHYYAFICHSCFECMNW
jgi:hypothetical protein